MILNFILTQYNKIEVPFLSMRAHLKIIFNGFLYGFHQWIYRVSEKVLMYVYVIHLIWLCHVSCANKILFVFTIKRDT